MQRELIFRAFNKKTKVMASVSNLYWNGKVHVSWTDKDLYEQEKHSSRMFAGSVAADWEKEECIIMQYTGLAINFKDPIFEGDIIKFYTEDKSVSETHCVYIPQFYFTWDTFYDKSIYTKIEKIGNIYENPELLNS